jgi:hypothetical protein
MNTSVLLPAHTDAVIQIRLTAPHTSKMINMYNPECVPLVFPQDTQKVTVILSDGIVLQVIFIDAGMFSVLPVAL